MSGLYLPLQRSSILGGQSSGDPYPVVPNVVNVYTSLGQTGFLEWGRLLCCIS